MGSSGSGAVDCGVGSIVWVRRRNGSWWPGKILGPEELAASHLTSPRSGTPVKLLGREDASVDWYNLEKSKRVKAFRCGEFDDCIERAESSQGMPIKKREKYARREDAILHALELEKELLRKQGKLVLECGRSKSSALEKKDLVTFSGGLEVNNGKPGNSKSSQTLKKEDTFCKDEHIGNPLYLQKAKEGNQPSWEDDQSEVLPRMRGLQDFGLRTGTSKRKFTGPDDSAKPIADGNYGSLSCDLNVGRTSHSNRGEQMGGTSRAKRGRCMHMPSESDDNMEKEVSTSSVEIVPSKFCYVDHPFHHPSRTEENAEFAEDIETDSSESATSESHSDSSETEADIEEVIAAFSGAAGPTEPKLALERQIALDDGSVSSEEHHSSLSGEISHLYLQEPVSANEAVSKWQSKGKRNVRNLKKRSADTEGRSFNGSTSRIYQEENGASFRQRSLGQSLTFHANDGFTDDIDGEEASRPNFKIRKVKVSGGGYLSSSWEDHTYMKRHWDNKVDPMFISRHPFGGRTKPMLIDVDLKVQVSYQKERVPIVSLMSKYNGQAIIGHPVQIEVIPDGLSENLLPTCDYWSSEAIYHDGNTALPPAWRTARRTNSRTPRSHLLSSLDGDEASEDHAFRDEGREPSFEKLRVGSFGHKGSLVKKSFCHIPRPPTDKKGQRKPPKKVSLLSSSQKTRTLASIGIEQNHSVKAIHDSNNCQMDGFIKRESLGPPTVACIPVKLVFSRLLEKINRPPSKAANKAVLVSNGS